MHEILSDGLRESTDVRFAVAFVSMPGLKLIMEPLRKCIDSGVSFEILAGLDGRITESRALSYLNELSENNENVNLYCYTDIAGMGIYHPKLYIFGQGDMFTVVTGSSNLTDGGLRNNVEVNVAVTTSADGEFASDVHEVYTNLKFDDEKFKPDDEYIDMYKELSSIEKAHSSKPIHDKSLGNLQERFREKTESLRKPKPSNRDLAGWLELVYNSLPDGEFNTSDIYKYGKEFNKSYPENKNVDEKIRQQLQILGKMGLIKHVKRGFWKKERFE